MLLIQCIKKDFFAYRKTLLWIPFYILLFPAFFAWITDKNSLYFLLTLMCTYMWLGSVLAYDEKYKAEAITGILPVKRSTVLLGKLLMSDMVFAGVTIVYIFLSLLNTFVPAIPVQIFIFPSWQNITAALLFVSFMLMLIMPVCYKLGYQKSRIILVFVFVIAIMLCTGILSVINTILQTESNEITIDNLMAGAVQGGVSWIMLILSIVLQAITFLLSYRFVCKRDV